GHARSRQEGFGEQRLLSVPHDQYGARSVSRGERCQGPGEVSFGTGTRGRRRRSNAGCRVVHGLHSERRFEAPRLEDAVVRRQDRGARFAGAGGVPGDTESGYVVYTISKIASTSTATPVGKEAKPRALRAWKPRSSLPKSWWSRSEAPLTTRC